MCCEEVAAAVTDQDGRGHLHPHTIIISAVRQQYWWKTWLPAASLAVNGFSFFLFLLARVNARNNPQFLLVSKLVSVPFLQEDDDDHDGN